MGSGSVLMNPNALYVEDYTVLSGVNTDVSQMTVEGSFPVGTVYVFDGAAWVTTGASAGDILLFANNGSGYVWAVYVTHGELPPPTDDPDDPDNPDDPDDPDDPAGPGGADTPGGAGGQQMPSGGGGFSGGGFSGGYMTQEEEYEFYPLDGTVIMAVTPLENMRVTLSIDELDILSVRRAGGRRNDRCSARSEL